MRIRFRFATLFAAFLWLFMTAAPATAQYFGRNKVQYDDFSFRSFNTDHFEFYFYPEEKQAVEDAARMGERWYRRHSRTFLREFHERKPVILYANDADFQQTNVIGGFIGQGTGGVTESIKERVVMPLTGIYSETDHVLGHELVHSFQYDIGLMREDSTRFSLQLLPLWLVEGMAEYFSVGREDPHTAMWLRDAVLRDDLPTIEDLNNPNEYFPYRYGQAYLAYIGGKYGDPAVANLFKLGGRTGLDSAFVYTLGINADSLSAEWQQIVKDAYLPLMEGRTAPDSAGKLVLAKSIDAGAMNISPSVSPDGKYVAYLSEQDLFNINLFIADAETGKRIKKLKATNSDPHFDAIRFINSAGSWSPDGKRLAFVTFVEGDNEISIWNVDSGEIERRIKVKGVSALSNPAWSPDGQSIAFSGIDGGISDLYVLDIESNAVRQLTNDRYADLQPAWSPDGETIAVVTDRGPEGTDFQTLSYGEPRIALIDVATAEMQIVRPFPGAKHVNPQFSPDGRSLYLISDQDGFSDVYRYVLATGDVYRITRLKTGVSGITALSPAMTVAMQSGRMMFSVFSDNEYNVFSLEPDELQGAPVTQTDVTEGKEQLATAGLLPPFRPPTEGLVGNYLNDPLTGLPDQENYRSNSYSPRLRLDYVAPPTFGASVGGPYGAGLAGGVGFFFSDMLGNQNLSIVAQANGTFKDIGGQVAYLNRGNRFNWGGAVSHIPLLYGGTALSQTPEGYTAIQEIRQRIYIDQALAIGSYPFSTTRRIEGNVGFTRYGYDFEAIQYTFLPGGGVSRDRVNLNNLEPDPVYFVRSGLAYIGDYANFGFTSPLQGGRYRLEVSPQLGVTKRNNIGRQALVTVLADYRRYFFMNPITFAIRGMHVGNYGVSGQVGGPGSEATLFGREYLGYSYYPGFVRGYSFNSFDPGECGPDQITDQGTCAAFDRLMGTRIAVANAEFRLPLLGTKALGLINFPYLPTELTVFSDAGLAWNEGDNPFDLLKFETNTSARVPVVSVGTSARFNLLGYLIFEIYYAYPFQRPEKGAHFGFQLSPGW